MGRRPCGAIVTNLELKMNVENVMQNLEKKIGLTTHSYSHNRKYLENTEYFDINSSQNIKETDISDKAGNYIEEIDEAFKNSLEEIKDCYQFRKIKNFKKKRSQPSVSTRREQKKNLKILKYFSTLSILLITRYMNMVTPNNG